MPYRQDKRKIKIFITSIFIGLFVLSNLLSLTVFNTIISGGNDFSPNNELLIEPFTAAGETLSHFSISGSGDPLEARTYVINESYSNDNIENFNINAPSNNMRLSHGDLNFTFQNNYTTDHIIEDDSALYPNEQFENYQFDTSNFMLINNTGIFLDTNDNSYLTDGDSGTFRTLSSSSNKLNYTITGNFSDIASYNYLSFDRENILALITFITFNISEDVSLTIRMQNYSSSIWVNVSSNIEINSSLGIQNLNQIVINENLNYIDLDNKCRAEFYFVASSDFNLDLREISLNSTMGFELPITDQKQVALEFDLRGASSTVNGFYAWIRTLDISAASGKQLNISLYLANGTVARGGSIFQESDIIPETLLDSQLIEYIGDNLTYFSFNLDNTTDLTYGNYFIVIKSDALEGTYNLVTIPFPGTYGDGKLEHLLKITSYSGLNWTIPNLDQGGHIAPYLDASSFKLNVTRGYMPSDFNNLLMIQDNPLINENTRFYPFNESFTEYQSEWGKGLWNHTFSPYIEDISNNFQVNLIWDENVTGGFEFNVSYLVEAFKLDGTTTNYNVKYDGVPIWSLNHTLDTTIGNWNFSESWYIYPNDMDAHNLINPSYNDIYSLIEGELSHAENAAYDKVVIPFSMSNAGTYSLNLTSTNYITTDQQVHSYLNYNGTLYETRGFMCGDNISTSVEIQDHNGLAPLDGTANVSLFNDGAYQNSLVNSSGYLNSYLSYDFRNQTILDLTTSESLNNEYFLGYFWTNGTAIGCRKSQIFIDNYAFDISNFIYEEGLDKNLLSIIPDSDVQLDQDSYILTASVNETGMAFKPAYPILRSSINQVYSHNPGSRNFQISLNSFKQSEDILNPDEIINFKVELENLDDNFKIDVKIKVQLVSYTNNEWIIAENYSQVLSIDSSDSQTGENKKEFDVDLTIPSYDSATKIWNGLNAPIRKGGAKTIITIYFDDFNTLFGTYESGDYSLLINQTESQFEGHIIAFESHILKSGTPSYIVEFERNECLYNQSGYNTTIIANYYNDYYTSSYLDFIESFSLKMNGEFVNVSTIPSDIDDESEFNITSVLATEFGEVLSGKNIICQYLNASGWYNITDPLKTTDIDGETVFKIETSELINVGANFSIRLSWIGNDTISNVLKIIDLVREPSEAAISFSIVGSTATIYRGVQNFIRIIIANTGELKLSIQIDNISAYFIEFGGSVQCTIVSYDKFSLQDLDPSETTEISIQFTLPYTPLETINLNISITIKLVSEYSTFSYSVLSPPLPFPYITLLLTIMIISIIVISWIGSIYYALKTRKRITRSYRETVSKARPRRGRYVKPMELERITKPEIKKKTLVEEKPVLIKKEVKPKTTTDLDLLLIEEGLEKGPKKPELTRAALKKWNIDKLHNYCMQNKIKFSSKMTKSALIQKILEKNKK